MTIKVYDLCGANDLRFSPNCWRTRMAVAHKELTADFVPWLFNDKEAISFSGGKTVPVLVDRDTTIRGSWEIANYLEENYPDAPSLFGGEAGRAVTGFINAWADSTLHPGLIRCILPDIFDRIDDTDKNYFRESREKRFGMTIEAMRESQPQALANFNRALTPLRTILKSEEWMAGDTPAYADYIIFGAFQWARVTSPLQIVNADDPIHPWRERMLDLFDELGRGFPAAS